MLIKASRQKNVPIFIPGRASREERQLRLMAAMVQNEAQLEAILAGAKPELREACKRRIQPHLKFKLTETPQVAT